MAFKDTRNIKVCGQSGYNYKPTPAIMLKGQWLKEAGFDIGAQVKVQCENGRLVILRDKAREEELEAEKAFMEAETRKLKARFEAEKEEIRARFVAERKAGYGA